MYTKYTTQTQQKDYSNITQHIKFTDKHAKYVTILIGL